MNELDIIGLALVSVSVGIDHLGTDHSVGVDHLGSLASGVLGVGGRGGGCGGRARGCRAEAGAGLALSGPGPGGATAVRPLALGLLTPWSPARPLTPGLLGPWSGGTRGAGTGPGVARGSGASAQVRLVCSLNRK